MEEHWRAGYSDMSRTLRHPEVLQRPHEPGRRVHLRPRGQAANDGSRRTPAGEDDEDRRRPRSAPSPCRSTTRPIPPGPYRFYDREFSSSPTAPTPRSCAPSCPSRSRSTETLVKYEFIRMPDSTGFGDYTETGQVIPVRFSRGRQEGGYVARHVSRRQSARSPAAARSGAFPRSSPSPKICARERNPGRHAALRLGALRHRRPWATSTARLDLARDRRRAGQAELHDQDHPACRLHAAHLRAGALLSART